VPPLSGLFVPDSVPVFVSTDPEYVFVAKESIAILPPPPLPPSAELPLPPFPPLAVMVPDPVNVATLIQTLPPDPPPPA